uniref:mRNA-capping enzyme (Trinotate prediction) n=1 Tax=Henneguya salminicola TaxID=69463 RepID=A0A6G3MG28_HENSL
MSGTCHSVMKWKPDYLNSVDFYLKIHRVRLVGCLDQDEGHLYVMNLDSCFAKIKVCCFGLIKLTPELKKYDKRIIECTFDKTSQNWKFLRVREDKYAPNAYTTALSVCNTILQPVTIEDIYEAVMNDTHSLKKSNIENNQKSEIKID